MNLRNPLQVGDEAPDFRLQEASGRSLHLQKLCASGPVLLLFMRSPG